MGGKLLFLFQATEVFPTFHAERFQTEFELIFNSSIFFIIMLVNIQEWIPFFLSVSIFYHLDVRYKLQSKWFEVIFVVLQMDF